ncbi:MAG: UDP-N-acetylmuramoyl-L-alanine--D-glutamate ligase [Alphaproteobacteria bacterium]|nr:UDP-N-acetylmuramoyl-L-alanine--D-glutamate ligase [Rhizobiaceae bacterium]MBU3963954.1 UDP-N-acetylmuramoyl-L-alanine--D-glutamate ligase [Alphaproteobacteria bacterium]MBU4049952.1 UDP-N-acetylmuramoyl-L-alanine--D-glutamate ligase [Alphaproteobacteria bacterium]MBU4090854.1 UDP-N-acetylmuramoyl-L-alanine--D-glutamate ligase [Alphaproteobacteria bacterium]MBU4155259.1 UDP-N-acetylmuramoyl-L-alanine--D-glutamate ligase [Alphaproteobacteria bacterium]
MIPATTFKGKRVALFGLGGSGLATAKSLVAGGADVVCWDDNPDSVAKAKAEGIPTEDLRGIDWKAVSTLVLSPGVPLTHPKPHWSVDLARAEGVEVIGDVEIFVRERRIHAPDCPFIAITGTNGKSTTTALIAHILQSCGRDTQLGGNIGRAVLTLDPPKAGRFFVVECSSYQIDLAPTLNPTAGILLNVTPDHLDRHGTIQHYADVKERLVAGSGTAVIGVDDSYSELIADRVERAGSKVVRISKRQPLADGLYNDGHRIIEAHGGATAVLADLNGIQTLRGAHNAQNAAAAIAACLAVGVSPDEVRAGLSSFSGLKHRMQPVGRRGNVVFVNDSKATNAEAAAPALSSYERIHWIAGGLPKEGGIASLSPLFSRIAKAYLIGEAASAFASTLGNAVPYEISGTLAQAVAHAAADAAAENSPVAVMLSPACASFDQYKNFEVRGDAFVGHVAALDGVTMLVDVPTGGN